MIYLVRRLKVSPLGFVFLPYSGWNSLQVAFARINEVVEHVDEEVPHQEPSASKQNPSCPDAS